MIIQDFTHNTVLNTYFRRWGIGGDRDLRRWGVEEMGISGYGKWRRWGVPEMGTVADGKLRTCTVYIQVINST